MREAKIKERAKEIAAATGASEAEVEGELLRVAQESWAAEQTSKARRRQLERMTSRLREKYLPVQQRAGKHPTGATKTPAATTKAKNRARRKAARRTR